MTIGEIIKSYRTSQNMSQREFAIKCGLSNGIISIIEKGINPKTNEPIIPSLPTINSLANGMGMKIDNLFEMLDDMDISLTRNLSVRRNDRIDEFIENKDVDNIAIGNRLKQAREKHNMTQEDLGKLLGLNKSTIQRYESGQVKKIKLPILENIADILGVNPSWLVLKTDNPTPTQGYVSLTSDEKQVLDYYRNFNEEGKREARKRLKEMAKLDEYKKRAGFEEERREA